jgi:DNA-directed RNA polymerase specialized sigma24 family protein
MAIPGYRPNSPFTTRSCCLIIPPAKAMDLEDILKAGRFLDEVSLSVKKIIFANFSGLTEEEKEEIDQDVKLKILKMAARGKKIGNLRSYVWKMVYSTALDVIAGRSQALSLDEAVASANPPLLHCLDGLTPENLYEEKELLALLSGAVSSLPRRRRTAVLFHLQGLSLEETAVYMRESVNSVRHLVYRGLDDVKVRMSILSGKNHARRHKKSRKPRLELERT